MNNKWNPYSEEIKNMPAIYWAMAFQFLQIQKKHEWENTYLPLAEMIGQLTHPEIYKEYRKVKDRYDKLKDKGEGADFYKETATGTEGGGVANAHYDPNLGLVDNDGKVIVPKENYENALGLDGVAISY